MTEREMLLEIARLSAENRTLRGVKQPQAEYAPKATPRVARAVPVIRDAEEWFVKGEGVAIADSFTGTLLVGTPRAKGNKQPGMTRDCELRAGKACVQLTLNDGQLARLKAQGTRMYLGGRCYLVTLQH